MIGRRIGALAAAALSGGISTGPAPAQTPPAVFPTAVFVNRDFANLQGPIKADISGVDRIAHGTYRSIPYYAFVREPKTGAKRLISDGAFMAELELVPESVGVRTSDSGKLWSTAKYKVKIVQTASGKIPDFPDATVSVNGKECGEDVCFSVSGTPRDFAELPPTESDLTRYIVAKARPDETHSHEFQPWDGTFVHLPNAPFTYLTDGWDITNLDYLSLQGTHSRDSLFALPDNLSKRYRRVINDIALPYGWLYEEFALSTGGSTSTMMSTSRDVTNAAKRTLGFNLTASVEANEPGVVEASASFSIKSSNSEMQKFGNMEADKTSYTQTQFHHTAYAFVVNKIELPLDDDFRDEVASRADFLEAGTLDDESLRDFLQHFGTHYAYAVTYGTQGAATFKMTEQQVAKLIEQNVDYSLAMSAKASLKVFGVGGSLETGTQAEHAQEMANKFDQIVSASDTSYYCDGGSGCTENGTPSGEKQVPIFVDLRPISDLLAPPYFTDPKIVFGLRERLRAFIETYAFAAAPPDTTRIFELTLQPPDCRDDAYAITSCAWGPVTLSAQPGDILAPDPQSRNITTTPDNPSIATADFSKGAARAILVARSGDKASLGASGAVTYTVDLKRPGVGPVQTTDSLTFGPQVVATGPAERERAVEFVTTRRHDAPPGVMAWVDVGPFSSAFSVHVAPIDKDLAGLLGIRSTYQTIVRRAAQ